MPHQKLPQADRKLKLVAIAAFFVIAVITATLLKFYGTIHPAEPVRDIEAPLSPAPISSLIHIGPDGIGIFFTAKGASNITVIPSIK